MRIIKYNKGAKSNSSGDSTTYNVTEYLAQQESVASTVATNIANNVATSVQTSLQEEIAQKVDNTSVYTKEEVDELVNTSVNIDSVTATESDASGGNNTVTVTLTDGTSTSFNVKNGKDGADGISLGEIGLVQESGNNTDKVMSQKAVTEYGRKITLGDINGISDYVKNILEDEGWIFGSYLRSDGNTAANTSQPYVITPIIPVDYDICNHKLIFCYRNNKNTASYVNHYRPNDLRGYTIGLNSDNEQATTPTNNVFHEVIGFRYTINYNDIPNCYIYDDTIDHYIWRGDYYLYELLKDRNLVVPYDMFYSKLMAQELGDNKFIAVSQDAITKGINNANYSYMKPNYFKGTLTSYELADYPDLDPRVNDGISILFDGRMLGMSERSMFLEIVPKSYYLARDNIFAIAQDYGNIRAGLMNNYYMVDVNSSSYTLASGQAAFSQMAITFSFVTGELKVYNNGVLIGTGTNDNWDEAQLRTYFDTATILNMGHYRINSNEALTSMAVFPRVIEESEVSELFGIGAKHDLISQSWYANKLHSTLYTGNNIGIYNANTVTVTYEGDAAVLTVTKNRVQFGFTGITGVINNLIYEWDMEIVSGTWKQNWENNNRKGMIYNGSYYDVVKIYDTDGNDVSYNELTTGNYHVICKPDNLLATDVNATSNRLNYIFTGVEVDSVMKVTNLEIMERGAALICDVNNFKGNYFLQTNGTQLPKAKIAEYNTSVCTPFYDSFVDDVIEYKSNVKPQFTGQMAIGGDKIYFGSLAGGWKQINNN